jgi:predicted RNA-binding Zn ribbon-like protein
MTLMDTPEHIRKNRLVGGNPALDFVNTQGSQPDDEVLHDYGDVVAWAQHAGGLADADANALQVRAIANPAAARVAYDRALDLRAGLDKAFGAIVAGRQPSPSVMASLRTAEADALAHAELVATHGAFAWSWAGDDDLLRPLRPIVHAAIALLTNGPLERLEHCAGCSFVFLDESKNHSRRWCSMDDCGAAEKARRFVARRAEARRNA